MDNENRIRRKIEKDPDSIIVAEEEGKVVGTVSTMDDSRTAFIFRLAVDKNHRKQGLGSRLMTSAEELLRKRGYDKVQILVDEEELDLQKYYAELGYETGNPYRWMTKSL